MVQECTILSYGSGSIQLNMNKLGEYLVEHYNPGGNAFKIVLVPELIEKSGFTVEEVHLIVIDLYKEEKGLNR